MMNIESIIKKLFAFFAIISLFIGIIGCRPNIKNITLGASDELTRKDTSTASIHSQSGGGSGESQTSTNSSSLLAQSKPQASKATSSKNSFSSLSAQSKSASQATVIPHEIGSLVSGGYVYYGSFTNNGTGIYKKKADGTGSAIKVSNYTSHNVLVFNNYIYFICWIEPYLSKLCRTDLNGNNFKVLDDEKYEEIWIGGEWIFAKSMDKKLFMIRIDGSEKRALNRQENNMHSSDSMVFGIENGYFYYFVADSWRIPSPSSSSLPCITSDGGHYRIDYKSTNPTPQRLDVDLQGILRSGYCYYADNQLYKMDINSGESKSVCSLPYSSTGLVAVSDNYAVMTTFKNSSNHFVLINLRTNAITEKALKENSSLFTYAVDYKNGEGYFMFEELHNRTLIRVDSNGNVINILTVPC